MSQSSSCSVPNAPTSTTANCRPSRKYFSIAHHAATFSLYPNSPVTTIYMMPLCSWKLIYRWDLLFTSIKTAHCSTPIVRVTHPVVSVLSCRNFLQSTIDRHPRNTSLSTMSATTMAVGDSKPTSKLPDFDPEKDTLPNEVTCSLTLARHILTFFTVLGHTS
jgi:hypothetical protein